MLCIGENTPEIKYKKKYQEMEFHLKIFDPGSSEEVPTKFEPL